MSTSVAPLPTGTGLSPISEQRSRQERPPREQREGEHHADGEHAHGQPAERFTLETPPVPIEEELVPAETLFAAALLANEMPPEPLSPEALRLINGQGWTPPESALRLKDKTI